MSLSLSILICKWDNSSQTLRRIKIDKTKKYLWKSSAHAILTAKSEIFSSKAFWTSILMYALFSPHINQLLATSRVSYKSTLFQHYLPGNSVRFYTLRIKSQRTSPQPLLHFRHQSQFQVVTCIYDWLAVHQRFPHPLLGFDSFARAAYRNERNI